MSRKQGRRRHEEEGPLGGQAVSGQGNGKVQRERTQRNRHRDERASAEDEESTLSTKPREVAGG